VKIAAGEEQNWHKKLINILSSSDDIDLICEEDFFCKNSDLTKEFCSTLSLQMHLYPLVACFVSTIRIQISRRNSVQHSRCRCISILLLLALCLQFLQAAADETPEHREKRMQREAEQKVHTQ